jgi:hypothetical protein
MHKEQAGLHPDKITNIPSSWYELEGESIDNLEPVSWRRPARPDESVGKRLMRLALEDMRPCDHNYGGGLGHWWGNPRMLSPCELTRIDGQWYRRKSCADVPPVEEWEND